MFDLEELVATTSGKIQKLLLAENWFLEFMDRNAKKVLASEDFLHLSANALVKLVQVKFILCFIQCGVSKT